MSRLERQIASVIIASIALSSAKPQSWAQALESEAPAAGWLLAVEALSLERNLFADHLERAHRTLVARAEEEAPELLERLSPEAPEPRASGYGILPEVRANKTLSSTAPERQSYSLSNLSSAYAENIDDAERLASRANFDFQSRLESMVTDFERLRKRLENFEDHLAYHRQWQESVREHRRFFAEKNLLLERVEAWHRLSLTGADPGAIANARHEVAHLVAPFRPTPGLAVERRDDRLVLSVHVLTDIQDEGFLDIFRRAVDEAFSASPAARARNFDIELRLEKVALQSLYPEGPPNQGATVAVEDHVARFHQDSLVLTTGAPSTRARVSRFIQLGSSPLSPRTLAHEFGHLLGFSDGYLRAYEGSLEDPYGVVIVEWRGLGEGLMAAPGRGRVTAAMVDRLIAAYD